MRLRYAAGFRSDLSMNYNKCEKLAKKCIAFATAALKDATKCTEEWSNKVIEANEEMKKLATRPRTICLALAFSKNSYDFVCWFGRKMGGGCWGQTASVTLSNGRLI